MKDPQKQYGEKRKAGLLNTLRGGLGKGSHVRWSFLLNQKCIGRAFKSGSSFETWGRERGGQKGSINLGPD